MQQLEFFEVIDKPTSVCLVCKKTFEKTTYNRKYCSRLCFIKSKPRYKYTPSDLSKKEKKCCSCEKILPIDNFQTCDKYGARRGKCIPCQKEYKQKIKGTFEEYKKEKSYREELHTLQKENKRRCRLCLEINSLDDFHFSNCKKVFYNKKSYCKKCARNVYLRPYAQSPIGKLKKSKWDKKYNLKPDVIERRNKKHTERYRNDPQYKIMINLRGRMKNIFKIKNIKKTNKTIDLLGCSKQEAINHIQSQFKEGMTWENHGHFGWHIDHIIPCSSFDLADPEQQKKCFHYTNLQPLWWQDNLSKGCKILS
jgi:hypothetical protein